MAGPTWYISFWILWTLSATIATLAIIYFVKFGSNLVPLFKILRWPVKTTSQAIKKIKSDWNKAYTEVVEEVLEETDI